MTIKQYFKNKTGVWNFNCNYEKPYRYMNVNVVFESPDNDMDETQFSIRAFDISELDELFSNFCKENNYSQNTVFNIIVTQVAETMEELD